MEHETSQSILQEHKIFLKSGGLFETPKGFLKITGPDRVDFLHRLTSQDIKNLAVDTGAGAALLEANAALVSFFDIYNCGQYLLIVVDESSLQTAHDFLEKFHFAENVEIKNVSAEFKFLSVQGKLAAPALRSFLEKVPRYKREILGNEETFVAQKGDFVSEGFHLFVKADRYEQIKKQLESQGLQKLSQDLWKLLRAEAGYFSFGTDISEKNLILESTLSEYVARDKGCYPGQEVVERVFTYGNVAKKLVGLQWKSAEEIVPFPAEGRLKLRVGAEDAGYVTSSYVLPWSKEAVGFGIVRKPHYEPGVELAVEGSPTTKVEVLELPNTFEIKKR